MGSNELDVAWAAGFFDGEGYVGLCGSQINGSIGARVHVGQKSREPLDKLASMFGGNVLWRSSGLGIWKWELNGVKAISVLVALLPYLTVKRTQAELAIKFADLKAGGLSWEDQLQYQQDMKDLKRIDQKV